MHIFNISQKKFSTGTEVGIPWLVSKISSILGDSSQDNIKVFPLDLYLSYFCLKRLRFLLCQYPDLFWIAFFQISIYLYLYLFIYLSIHIFVYIYLYLRVYISSFIYLHLFISLFIYIFICVYIYISSLF
jgi:hypothetical protein